MEGRFVKVDVGEFNFDGGDGIYCNNQDKDIAYAVMQEKFGKPNANSLRLDVSTWKYVLLYEGIFLTVYDYESLWSIGFAELTCKVLDYEIMKSFARMLFNYIEGQIDLAKKSITV